ncbi:MAG: PspC domain-containing protein, partial [Nocardioidaceae bacterium]|nr:PspC domain-containing protein [Nocardioidaceae bacterium]
MGQPLVEPRHAFRDRDDRLLGGVASGVGRHLGLTALQARVGFLALTLLGGFGAFVYAGLWVFLPIADSPRTPFAATESRRDMGVAVCLAAVGMGIVLLLQNVGLGVNPALFWPLLVASAGLALLWWQTDRSAWSPSRPGWIGWLRLTAGVALLATAEALVVFQAGLPDGLIGFLILVGLAVLGLGLVVGPWLLRLSRDLRLERQRRIRTEERDDVAAHLHDSVLQTLALIQRQAADPHVVAHLARTQERQLRTWLFDAPSTDVVTLKSALQTAVEEIEETHRIPIELVV